MFVGNLINKAMDSKLYWHELTEDDIEALYEVKTTWGDVQYQFRQPEWCTYPDALEGIMGCWSLIHRGTRRHICNDYCKTCVMHRDFKTN